MFAEIHKKTLKALPFVLTTMGLSTYQKPINRRTGFPDHQFLWVTEGSGSFTIDGDHFELEAGEGVFMRANTPNAYEGKNFFTSWCTFSMSEEMLDFLGVGKYLRFSAPSFLDREAKQLLEFANGDSTPVSRSAAGYSFVMELFAAILTPEDSLSKRALLLLEQKYAEPLTLLDISEELHVDKFTLCRIYKKERGVTVMEDLNRIRIAKAKRFLRYGTAPIEQVGKLCGFESPSYFGKRFREATGATPAEYRKALG